MREELQRFVASLAIPADRKTVLLAELTDHVASAAEAAAQNGEDPQAAGRAALGNLEALRRSLEAVEPAFRISRTQAFARGVVASLLVAAALDQGGAVMHGAVGALASLAFVAVCAPRHWLELLRAELRAPHVGNAIRVGRGAPIGPALTYAFTVVSGPIVGWIALIVERGLLAGTSSVQVPWSAFAVMSAVYFVLAVEALRARLQPAAA